jgi:hypothetical protein
LTSKARISLLVTASAFFFFASMIETPNKLMLLYER